MNNSLMLLYSISELSWYPNLILCLVESFILSQTHNDKNKHDCSRQVVYSICTALKEIFVHVLTFSVLICILIQTNWSILRGVNLIVNKHNYFIGVALNMKTLNMGQLTHVIMIVADVLAPNWCQAIRNHNADLIKAIKILFKLWQNGFLTLNVWWTKLKLGLIRSIS